MSVCKFTNGQRGASGKHVAYITRESACDDVSFHNLDELEAENEYEKKVNALSYAYNREDEETKGRTHYRVVLSWEDKEDTERAKEQAHKFLDENFDKAKGIVAIHQDTDHTHAHVWVDARQVDDKKIQIDRNTYKQLDEKWTQQYDREYKTDYAPQYKARKEEKREFKRAKAQGRDAKEPERPKMTSEKFREKDARDRGVKSNGINESRTGRNQRPFAVRDSNSQEAERAITGSKQNLEQSNKQFDRTESEARNLHKDTTKLVERERRGDIER